MGIFGKKKEPIEDQVSKKSEEFVLKEALEIEVENLQKEFRVRQEEIENITKKLQSVKEEYDTATSNLMAVKKESNQKKMELDTTYLEYKNIKLKINDADQRLSKNKNSIDELDKVESNIIKFKQEFEKITKEYEQVKEKTIKEQLSLQEIQTQQNQTRGELDQINLRIHNIKQDEKNRNMDSTIQSDIFTFNKKEITDKKESKGIIEAASVVVASLKLKITRVEKEMEIIQSVLEKERSDHIKTKNELKKLEEKLNNKEK